MRDPEPDIYSWGVTYAHDGTWVLDEEPAPEEPHPTE